MSINDVDIKEVGDLLCIELSRSQAGNALNLAMCEAMVASLIDLPEHIKVVKISAQGENCCTGRDSRQCLRGWLCFGVCVRHDLCWSNGMV